MVLGFVPDVLGIVNIWPIWSGVVGDILLVLASKDTDTPYWLLIPYRVSPDTIFM